MGDYKCHDPKLLPASVMNTTWRKVALCYRLTFRRFYEMPEHCQRNNNTSTRSVHAVSAPHVSTLCQHPVSAPCVSTMCQHPMSAPSVSSMCQHPVSAPCVSTLCQHPVSAPCVSTLPMISRCQFVYTSIIYVLVY